MPETRPNFTLTGLAPDGLLAALEAAGARAPFGLDGYARGLVTDADGHGVLFVVRPVVDEAPDLANKLATFVAAALNALTAEARAIRDPFDPKHLDAVSEQSRALAEKLSRNRPAAE